MTCHTCTHKLICVKKEAFQITCRDLKEYGISREGRSYVPIESSKDTILTIRCAHYRPGLPDREEVTDDKYNA